MSPEERDELIHFILQSQSDAAERHREFIEEHRKSMEEHRENMEKEHRRSMEEHRRSMEQIREMREQQRETMAVQKEHTIQIQMLASASHAFLEVARIQSRRLDHLEGL